MALTRTFKDIPDGNVAEATERAFLRGLGWSEGFTWDELLQSQRVLIISEAGAGKTWECRQQAVRLNSERQAAFFVELATLAGVPFRDTLDASERERLDQWISSQSEVATFFLDSMDELNLTRTSFTLALKRFSEGISAQLGRARIVITSRPTPFDEEAVRRHLFIPSVPSSRTPDEEFAGIAMGEDLNGSLNGVGGKRVRPWRTVALMPLSDEEMVQFALMRGVDDAGELVEDLRERDALEFARRPLDLNDVCTSWRQHKRIGTHREQVVTDVRFKLRPREDRPEPAELTVDRAFEGASRLALGLVLTRRFTIRHGAESDVMGQEAALDPDEILQDWLPSERRALLERALFGFASYGRVRFHHRTVIDYLAADRLRRLHTRGTCSFAVIRERIFTRTHDKLIARPSMRAVAGWLALSEIGIFELLRDNEPAVLLGEGDPRSLPPRHREQALEAYVQRYSGGGWRGLSVPSVQLHRFGSKGLAPTINRLWGNGIESPDVREMLLSMVALGRISGCADLLHETAGSGDCSLTERMIALDGLLVVGDPRIGYFSAAIAEGGEAWSDRLSLIAIRKLFPAHMTAGQLCAVLGRLKKRGRKANVEELDQLLPLIADAEISASELANLRDGLLVLLGQGLRWQDGWPHVISDQAHLANALAVVSARGLRVSCDHRWLHACAVALCLRHRDSDPGLGKELRERIADFDAENFSKLFWAVDAFIHGLNPTREPAPRFLEVIGSDGLDLVLNRDIGWIKRDLAAVSRAVGERSMMLHALAWLVPVARQRARFADLRPLVTDAPALLSLLDDIAVRPSADGAKRKNKSAMAKKKEREKRRAVTDQASWIAFRRRVLDHPDEVFADSNEDMTAWNLSKVMSFNRDDQRWNRQFIERHFNRHTADRLRSALMRMWRRQRPTLPSERPKNKRNSYWSPWVVGLAGVFAEAEDSGWAARLADVDAELAARLAPVQLDGMPRWLEDLIAVHPAAVDRTLGEELSWELRQPARSSSVNLLQSIRYAPTGIGSFFVGRVLAWLDEEDVGTLQKADSEGDLRRVELAVQAVMKHADSKAQEAFLELASRHLAGPLRLYAELIWLPVVIQLDPARGIAALERRLENVAPSKYSSAVAIFGKLFGDRDAISLANTSFTPDLLLRLVRLGHRHVRSEDDWHREGNYLSDIRDEAEGARDALVKALLDAKGDGAWEAKLQMVADPLCAGSKDRIFALAEENWAEEMDAASFDEAQVVEFDSTGEASPSTNESMFAVMMDRIERIKDSLLRDDTTRDLLISVSDEHVMRRSISNLFRQHAHGFYRVSQEGVTAEEKETDIRLSSIRTDHEAVIEIKIGDNHWSAGILRDTIRRQLVEKYMAPENRRSGCLIITVHGRKKWKHPDTGSSIDASGLSELLETEARVVERDIGSGVRLAVAVIDLRPRLPTESGRRRNSKKGVATADLG
ncbi:ATP-binding protein [Rhizobium leguminosarum bv. viciae]|uniref:ATP-binding protein n=1 Tax=Rhizobium leguminosarum TaxID=384 RepID=UPI0010388139|nr:ATP-binding protein [Rhizobium leguminosarum]TCA18552.1 ATP-binding protein [Rhizobium leguminosarum bv. viciae]